MVDIKYLYICPVAAAHVRVLYSISSVTRVCRVARVVTRLVFIVPPARVVQVSCASEHLFVVHNVCTCTSLLDAAPTFCNV